MIPDNPISTKEKDLLYRYPLARKIAEVVNRFEEKGIKGEEYLEKIIQVSFTLPRLDPHGSSHESEELLNLTFVRIPTIHAISGVIQCDNKLCSGGIVQSIDL